MQDSLMNQGIELMVFGMGTVFIFLTLLVLLTSLMSLLIRKWLPEKAVLKTSAQTSPSPATPANAMDDPQLVAVITAAIKAHRASQK